MVSFYGSTAVSVFPKITAGVKSAESAFIQGRLRKRKEVCCSSGWKGKKPDVMTSFEWEALFGVVEVCLFLAWTRMMTMDDNRQALAVPAAPSVSPHAKSSCYYLASWTLSRWANSPWKVRTLSRLGAAIVGPVVGDSPKGPARLLSTLVATAIR